MIPKIIHLVWLGEMVSQVQDAEADYRRLNPAYRVVVHTDDTDLNQAYRNTYDTYAPLPQLRSDLIRWSVLEKYGGWYFDIDIVPLVDLTTIERQLGLDGERMFLTVRRSFPVNDVISVGRNWRHWDRFHSYLRGYRATRFQDGSIGIYYSAFSVDLIMRAVIGSDSRDGERWTPDPNDMWSGDSRSGYGVRAGRAMPEWFTDEPTTLESPSGAGGNTLKSTRRLMKRAVSAGRAMLAGKRVSAARSKERLTICKACEHVKAKKKSREKTVLRCGLCDCKVSHGRLLNLTLYEENLDAGYGCKSRGGSRWKKAGL
jgi:hypothetical protein